MPNLIQVPIVGPKGLVMAIGYPERKLTYHKQQIPTAMQKK